jgi:hypothetical protein
MRIKLNVIHRAGLPLTLNGHEVQRCEHCGDLLYCEHMPGEAMPVGAFISFVGQVANEAGRVNDLIVVHKIHEEMFERSEVLMCYVRVIDKEGNMLLSQGERKEVCEYCARGVYVKLLDADGVICGLSGEAGTWAHAADDKWWPCKGVMRAPER